MNKSGQYQSAENARGSMDWGATISGSYEASLAYPHRNEGVQTEGYDLQHHTVIAQPNNEGATYLSIPGSSYAWGMVPEAYGWSRASLSPAQRPPEGPPSLLQETPVLVDPYKATNVQRQGDMQSRHAQVPYSHCLVSASDAGYHPPLTATDLQWHTQMPTFESNIGSFPGTVDGFMNTGNRAEVVRRAGRAIGPRSGRDMAPYLGLTEKGDMPISANYGIGFSFPYIRRTKTGRRAPVCGPPQTFEGCPDILATRLADEGADPDAVDLIRRDIFVGEVTEEALTAPIESRKLSLKYGGARKKWQLLLQVTDIAPEPGAKSYCCRLCPQELRPEHKYAADGLRHLKRDHFGMAVACQYCGHEFFRKAEKNRHVRGCKKRPAMGI